MKVLNPHCKFFYWHFCFCAIIPTPFTMPHLFFLTPRHQYGIVAKPALRYRGISPTPYTLCRITKPALHCPILCPTKNFFCKTAVLLFATNRILITVLSLIPSWPRPSPYLISTFLPPCTKPVFLCWATLPQTLPRFGYKKRIITVSLPQITPVISFSTHNLILPTPRVLHWMINHFSMRSLQMNKKTPYPAHLT
jgi:hypothetical protein